MSDFPRMVYKAGGPHEFNDGRFDYIVVDDEEALSGALVDGWCMTTADALKSKQPVGESPPEPIDTLDDAPPTRAELEAKARELHIKFDGRTSDEKLGEKITAALAAARG